MTNDEVNQYILENIERNSREISEELSIRGIALTSKAVRLRKIYLRKKHGIGQKPNVLEDKCEELGIDPKSVASAWIKSKDFSLQIVHNAEGLEDRLEAFFDRIKKNSIKVPKRKKVKTGHLYVFAPSDIHIGKYSRAPEVAVDYDIKTAVSRVHTACHELLEQVSTYEISKIVLVGGNDVLHIDTPKGTTTSGTVMDYQGLWWEMIENAFDMYVSIIDSLLEVAEVYIPWVVSNHDFTMGSCVGRMLKAYYHNNPNVEFDCSMAHRKYMVFGKNLLGFSHGDGAPIGDMPLLMANESPKGWAETKYRYFYLGHIHHYKKMKWVSGEDYIGVTAQYLRSPSPADRWHSTNGFLNQQAIEGFIHHPEFGQISSHTHYF